MIDFLVGRVEKYPYRASADLFRRDDDASPLEHWVHAHMAERPGEPLALPDVEHGHLFKYTLCYLEDPDGFVPPTKHREQVMEHLAYFGLVDATTADSMKTRKQWMEMEDQLRHHTRLLAVVTFVACVHIGAFGRESWSQNALAASIATSDAAFASHLGVIVTLMRTTPDERAADIGTCRAALLQHPGLYTR